MERQTPSHGQLPAQTGQPLRREEGTPVARAAPVASAAPAATRVQEKVTGTILIVEDNPATRKMFHVALESAGFEVVEAGDARTALDIVSRRRPDLVVQDLVLPDMDGLELLRELRKRFGDAPVPIFCVSGFLSRLDEARAEEGGFTAVLLKPVDPIHLIELVRSHFVAMSMASEVSGSGQRILLVDDDPLQLKLAHVWLANAGFEVLAATDGASALEEARRHRPDAIVSDVLMPGIDGFALCLAVRRAKETGNIPVILTSSSYAEESDRALAARVGASALVAKTEGLESVARAIRAALQQQPPPSPGDSIETLKDEHAKRALWQLERQVRQNAHLAHRSALQAAQLAVLAGVSEALARKRTLDGVLGDVLASCLDMAGISKGVLYIAEANGRLAFTHQIGFSETERPRVRRVFDCEDEIRDMAGGGKVVPVPSVTIPPDLAQKLIAGMGATALLVVPVSWGETIYGAAMLGARSVDIFGEDALAFARVLGAQIGQALGLSQAFASLAASEHRYRTLTENANDAICVLTPDGTITEANRRFSEIVGRPADLLVGRPFGDFVTRARQDGAVRGLNTADEVRQADGGVVLMEFSNTPVEVEGERLVLVIGRDVTELVHSQLRGRQLEDEQERTREELVRSEAAAHAAAKALAASEERFQLAVSGATAGLWDWNPQTGAIYFSPHFKGIMGYDDDELPNERQAHFDAIHPDDVGSVTQALKAHLARRIPYDVEYRVRTKPGDFRWIQSRGQALWNDAGEPYRMVGWIMDITDRKRNEEALRVSREELRRLSAHIQQIREEEKARIARELHDDLGQELTALKMAVMCVEHRNPGRPAALVSRDDLRGIYVLIDRLIDSVRRIAADLRPVMLDDLGLIPAIEWLADEFSARYQIRVIRHIDTEAIIFNRECGIEVFRMVQEALTNVARHSGATEVVLDIVIDDPNCIVRIVDNGRGAARDARSGRHSFGLLGMHERAALLGGNIQIRTAPGSGFALTATLPLAAVEARETE